MVSSIEAFLDLRPGQLNLTLRGLRSIIAVDSHLSSFHASFLDFLFDPSRAKDYHVDLEECYVSNCYRVFSLVKRSIPVLRVSRTQNRLESIVVTYFKLMNRTNYSHPTCYNLQQIETCITQCSRRCSNKASLRDVIARSLRDSSWSQVLNGSFQETFLVVAEILVEMIHIVQVCPYGMCDETL